MAPEELVNLPSSEIQTVRASGVPTLAVRCTRILSGPCTDIDPFSAKLITGGVLPTADSARLLATVWLRSEAGPSEADLGEIVRLAGLFPRDPRLTLSVALVCARHGRLADAARLIDSGLVLAVRPEDRAALLQLKAGIDPVLAARSTAP